MVRPSWERAAVLLSEPVEKVQVESAQVEVSAEVSLPVAMLTESVAQQALLGQSVPLAVSEVESRLVERALPERAAVHSALV
jgi:hypothetical protein